MADKVKVKLLRPLDGQAEGSTASYSEADARRLESRGAVVRVSGSKAEEAPQNKMEDAPENKADVTTANRTTKKAARS